MIAGKRAGLTEDQLENKKRIVKQALEINRPDPKDPKTSCQRYGALTWMVIGAAAESSIGLTVAFIGMAFGPLTGFAMDEARDFGPRLFCILAGWGPSVIGPNGYSSLSLCAHLTSEPS